MNVRLILAVTAALATLSEAPARAADTHTWQRAQNNQIELQLDFISTSITQTTEDFHGTISTLGLGIIPTLQFKVLDQIYADLEIPFAYGQVAATFQTDLSGGIRTSRTTGGFFFGNPTLGGHITRDLSDDLAVFAGGTVSIPVLTDPSDDSFAALTATKDMRAAYDIHRFFEEHLTFRARGGGELRIQPRLFYRGDLGLTLAIPTDHGKTKLNVEQGNELEYHTRDSGYGGGLRLQEVFRLADGDKLQMALEPFGIYELKDSDLYARLGLLIALDRPFGFGLDSGKIATLRLMVGDRF